MSSETKTTSDISISFRNVSKVYSPYHGLLAFKNFLSRIKNGQIGKKLIKENDFYALDDISFDIRKGERVGIIGRNGAGKSTILKLVNQIAFPTKGKIIARGDIGGLIELGAGFHPHLTGRDNIYINGAILGFTRKEVNEFIDSIISISELHEFIDVPIKKYSSGMKVRLGFAMMMATNPDIILLDEVLSVGDAAFKRKSMEMMKQYMQSKTLVFVSHSMGQIQTVCTRVILIEHGKIYYDGEIEGGVNAYNKLLGENRSTAKKSLKVARGLEKGFASEPLVIIEDFSIENSSGKNEIQHRDTVFLKIGYRVKKAAGHLNITVSVRKSVIGRFSDIIAEYMATLPSEKLKEKNGTGFLEVSFETANLLPGTYELTVKPEFENTPPKTAVVIEKKDIKIVSDEEQEYGGLVNLDFQVHSDT